ncbi:reverse transcriptase [Corchorus capsularis]|uniref:Reverse transcriptase n=1 Tax=Corchorus capsularis TaxID=210143 RepID=A0A1R3GC64_COCAP|nr:reverse transcriptase [Corchorus capsularis]
MATGGKGVKSRFSDRWKNEGMTFSMQFQRGEMSHTTKVQLQGKPHMFTLIPETECFENFVPPVDKPMIEESYISPASLHNPDHVSNLFHLHSSLPSLNNIPDTVSDNQSDTGDPSYLPPEDEDYIDQEGDGYQLMINRNPIASLDNSHQNVSPISIQHFSPEPNNNPDPPLHSSLVPAHNDTLNFHAVDHYSPEIQNPLNTESQIPLNSDQIQLQQEQSTLENSNPMPRCYIFDRTLNTYIPSTSQVDISDQSLSSEFPSDMGDRIATVIQQRRRIIRENRVTEEELSSGIRSLALKRSLEDEIEHGRVNKRSKAVSGVFIEDNAEGQASETISTRASGSRRGRKGIRKETVRRGRRKKIVWTRRQVDELCLFDVLVQMGSGSDVRDLSASLSMEENRAEALTEKALKQNIHKYDPDCVFLMETRNNRGMVDRIRKKLKFVGAVYVDPEGLSGGLALWWKEGWIVNSIEETKNFIDTVIEKDGVKFRITWIYGAPIYKDRKIVWDRIKRKAMGIDTAWMCIGDYNDIMDEDEKEGGNPKEQRIMQNFRNFINFCQLMEVPTQGQKFTWSGIRENGLIKERLDRSLMNLAWFETFSRSQVWNLISLGSDHSPLIFSSDVKDGKGSKKFKFEAYWCESDDYDGIIREGWGIDIDGNDAYKVICKLKKCRELLKKWCKEKDQNKQSKENIIKAISDLENVGDSVMDCEMIKDLENQLGKIWNHEEIYWHQRARINWIKSGDANTRFFHQSTLKRRQQNKVLRLKNGDNWVEEEEDIMTQFTSYYDNLFKSGRSENWEEVLECVPQLVDDEMNSGLTAIITDDEVRVAVFQLGELKSPGPDGFNGMFFQRHWNLIKDDICRMVRNFFRSGKLLKEMNATEIVLIPKVKRPEDVTQFRPISLCNFTYKIISKVLVNRMKPLMNVLVTENQSAFVEGRQIHDNVVIAQEVFHYLKLKKKGNQYDMAVKVDMKCVRTVSYSLVINGKSSRRVIPSRGLRQGDPLSPYLFILVIDALSRMIQTADPVNAKRLFDIIQVYSAASGQLINLDKSSLIFSANTPADIRQDLARCLQIREAENPGIYLGFRSTWGKTKCGALSYIKEKVEARLKSWKQQLLSLAGKEILIKAVASSIPAYVMMCFKFPKKVCADINSMVANFWWGQQDNEKRIHWVSWEKMTLPKEEGGMGFKELEAFNRALLAKQIWRILENPEAMWVKVLKGIYFPNADIMTAKKGARASWSWQSLLEGRNFIKEHLVWQVGDGKQVQIWHDNWIPEVGMLNIPEDMLQDRPEQVSELIEPSQKQWNLTEIDDLISPVERKAICSIPLGIVERTDKRIWPFTKTGQYSVKSGYYKLKNFDGCIQIGQKASTSHLIDRKIWKFMWSINCPPKIKVFLWRCVRNVIPTLWGLYRRGCHLNGVCGICGQEVETVEHLLLTCDWTRGVWFSICGLMIDKQSITSFDVWLWNLCNSLQESLDEAMPMISMIAFTCWIIWKSRCEVLLNHNVLSPDSTVIRIRKAVSEFLFIQLLHQKNLQNDNNEENQEQKWLRPPEGWLKINSDGSFCTKTNLAGIGFVVRNHDGQVLQATGKMCSATTALITEALALREAVGYIVRTGCHKAYFEVDSAELHRNIIEKDAVKLDWRIKHIVQDTQLMLNSIQEKEIRKICRSANKAADWFANQSRLRMLCRDWRQFPPSSLVKIWNKDGVPAPH